MPNSSVKASAVAEVGAAQHQHGKRQRHEGNRHTADIDRMPLARQRQVPDAAGDLGHALERGNEHGCGGSKAGGLQDGHQMHGQGAEHDRAGRHDQAEEHHGDGAGRAPRAAERRARPPASADLACAACSGVSRRASPSQCRGRHTSRLMAAKIEQRGAPAIGAVERVADGPEHAGGEAAEQREVGDGAPPARGRHLHQGGKGSIVERHAHGEAEEGPGGEIGVRVVNRAPAARGRRRRGPSRST